MWAAPPAVRHRDAAGGRPARRRPRRPPRHRDRQRLRGARLRLPHPAEHPADCGTRPACSATAWPASGVDATGWNWSAQFDGLGYDGDLDLYTVNGMVGEAFGYLPGAELQSTGWPMRSKRLQSIPPQLFSRGWLT